MTFDIQYTLIYGTILLLKTHLLPQFLVNRHKTVGLSKSNSAQKSQCKQTQKHIVL